MSQTAFNLVAISIFVVTLTSLLGPLLHVSPVIPAVTVFGLLGIATLDTLSWQGQVGTLVLDWWAQRSPEHRNRVIHHEAGHFLVAYLLSIPVTGYTLTAWDAFWQGQVGQGGVTFDSQSLEMATPEALTPLLENYFTLWMAGSVAENLVYGKSEGGVDDLQKFNLVWSQLKRPPSEGVLKERWSRLRAKTLLQQHWTAYEALVQALEQQWSVAECYQLLQRTIPTVSLEQNS